MTRKIIGGVVIAAALLIACIEVALPSTWEHWYWGENIDVRVDKTSLMLMPKDGPFAFVHLAPPTIGYGVTSPRPSGPYGFSIWSCGLRWNPCRRTED
jgi:hypothetical protein